MVKYDITASKTKDDNTVVMTTVKCPVYGGTNISKNGKGAEDVQRYPCNDKECPRKSFLPEYTCNGRKPGIDRDMISMTADASGIRDIAGVLKISGQKVSDTLKKQKVK